MPKYIGLRGRGIKKENWAVINQNNIPAVLCESGFMDSEIDYPVITSKKGQEGYAKAIAEGLIEFFELKKKTNVEKYNGYVKVIFDGLAIHNKPSWDNSTVSGLVKKNEVFTVVGRIKVDGVYMYKLKSGAYITSANKYVQYFTTLNTKTKEIKVGSKVKIKEGSVYGGLTKTRGKECSDYALNGKWVVKEIAENKGVKEAKLSGINSWVAIDSLTLV